MMVGASPKNVGKISLLVAIGGLIATWLVINLGGYDPFFLVVINYGFEAATIGGLADWFAVTALFREVKIPVLRRHTNIIVKNRQEIIAGIVDLLNEEWLSPAAIREKIAKLPLTAEIIGFLDRHQHDEKAAALLRELATKISADFNPARMAVFIETLLREILKSNDLIKLGGEWLREIVRRGDHYPLWEAVLTTAKEALKDDDTRQDIHRRIVGALNKIKERSWWKKFALGVAEIFKVFEVEQITDEIIYAVNKFINEVSGNPRHPTQKKIDEKLLSIADDLANGGKIYCYLGDVQHQLVEKQDLSDLILRLLASLKEFIRADLAKANSSLLNLGRDIFTQVLSTVRNDSVLQAALDRFWRDAADQVIDTYHPAIGKMVAENLGKLPPEEFTRQLEVRVGEDLQYIRLNGAVVGGLVGIILKTLSELLN